MNKLYINEFILNSASSTLSLYYLGLNHTFNNVFIPKWINIRETQLTFPIFVYLPMTWQWYNCLISYEQFIWQLYKAIFHKEIYCATRSVQMEIVFDNFRFWALRKIRSPLQHRPSPMPPPILFTEYQENSLKFLCWFINCVDVQASYSSWTEAEESFKLTLLESLQRQLLHTFALAK